MYVWRVEKKANCIWFHNHKKGLSAWMYVGVWRKNPTPYPSRQRKTLQATKAISLICSLVGFLKKKCPHNERKSSLPFYYLRAAKFLPPFASVAKPS
jgi:hypothetical protein